MFEKTESSYEVRYGFEKVGSQRNESDLYEQDIDIALKNVADQINDEVQTGNIERVYYHRKI